MFSNKNKLLNQWQFGADGGNSRSERLEIEEQFHFGIVENPRHLFGVEQ